MTADNVELVRRAVDAYGRHDLDALLPLLDPGVEVRSLMTEAEQATYRGYDGVRAWLAAVVDIFPDWRPRLESVDDLGDAVVTSIDVTGTGAESGVPIHHTFWQGFRLRGGKIVWFGFFRSEADARQATGG